MVRSVETSSASVTCRPAPREPGSGIEKATEVSEADRSISAGFAVAVRSGPIDYNAEIAPITRNPHVGAVANFVGVVRQCGDSDDVAALEIEHYAGMTERALWSILEEASARWDLQAAKVVHRTGRVPLGQPVVLVIAASGHRASAFAACEFIMDFLKSHAPFWKKEVRRDGSMSWVEAKDRDEQAMDRWG